MTHLDLVKSSYLDVQPIISYERIKKILNFTEDERSCIDSKLARCNSTNHTCVVILSIETGLRKAFKFIRIKNQWVLREIRLLICENGQWVTAFILALYIVWNLLFGHPIGTTQQKKQVLDKSTPIVRVHSRPNSSFQNKIEALLPSSSIKQIRDDIQVPERNRQLKPGSTNSSRNNEFQISEEEIQALFPDSNDVQLVVWPKGAHGFQPGQMAKPMSRYGLPRARGRSQGRFSSPVGQRYIPGTGIHTFDTTGRMIPTRSVKPSPPGSPGQIGRTVTGLDASKKGQDQSNLTPQEKRNSPSKQDLYFTDQDLTVFNGQAKFKMMRHGSDFGLDSYQKPNGVWKTRNTQENLETYKREIANLVENHERIDGTYRKGLEGGHDSIMFLNEETNHCAIFHKQERRFVSAWRLNNAQVKDLKENRNVGGY